ncbi:MAG: type II secretion system F family protein [Gemmatimonadetes bacterium]|nr:type II secretion system F family protein [Gemmatimonadota bacterium]NNM07439.1 type II secretion system F family protein [Gemmatimonadota bacterium]
MIYLISVLLAVSVGLLVMGIANLLPAQGRPSKGRLVELGLEEPFSKDAALRRGRRRTRLKDLLSYLGKKIESPTRDWSTSRTRLTHAGYRSPSALPIYLGARLIGAAILYIYALLGAIAIGATGVYAITFGLVGAGFGWVIPSFLLSRKVDLRQSEIQKALPDAVDLLVICVEAGLALNQALQRVAVEMRHASGILTMEISQMNMEIRAGTPRDQALISFAERTGVADLRSLATMLVQTERFGTSIADSLRVHADSMRTKRQQRAEEAAAKTTIKMVFPLAICIFPALFVVILGPALIQIFSALSNLGG